MFSKNADLLQMSNRVGIQFLLTEADTGLTFLEVAETTSIAGSRERNLTNAREAYITVVRLLDRVEPTREEMDFLAKKMAELRDGLIATGCSLGPDPFAGKSSAS